MSAPLEESQPYDERRFVTLETKLAYQEKTIADLNEVVVDQSRAFDKLTRRLTRLEQQIEQLLGQHDTPAEKPPHY
jgi:SlyX protein